jgi:uncharacterized iron-regulated membrane protein
VGVVIVLAISLVLHPPQIGVQQVKETPVPTVNMTVVTPNQTTIPTIPLPIVIAAPTGQQSDLQQLTFTKTPWLFPRYQMPDNLNIFGASDPAWRFNDTIAFAYLSDKRGGLTNNFTVQYPIWKINCTVTAVTHPERAQFQMVLVDAETGTIVTGMQFSYPGTMSRILQTSHHQFYMIIASQDVDRYSLTLETSPGYLS